MKPNEYIMSFAGHAIDMMKRMKANERLRKARRASFRQRKELISKSGASSKINPDAQPIKVISKFEQQKIRAKNREAIRKEKIMDRITGLAIVLFVIIALVLLYT